MGLVSVPSLLHFMIPVDSVSAWPQDFQLNALRILSCCTSSFLSLQIQSYRLGARLHERECRLRSHDPVLLELQAVGYWKAITWLSSCIWVCSNCYLSYLLLPPTLWGSYSITLYYDSVFHPLELLQSLQPGVRKGLWREYQHGDTGRYGKAISLSEWLLKSFCPSGMCRVKN